MLHAREVAQALAYHVLLDARDVARDARSQRVVYVVLACERQLLLLHVERRRLLDGILAVLHIADRAFLLQLRERILYSLDVVLLQLALDYWVVVPVDERVLVGLVLYDAHLRVHIVLHAVVVAVEMVGRDVQQDGNVGVEVVHVVELERAKLYDVVFVRILSHLQRKRASDVARQAHVVACRLEDMIDERRRCRLAVRAGDADHLRVGVATRKLYLADNVYTLLHRSLHHRSLLRYTRTLDDFVGRENLLLGMLTLLPLDGVVVEQLLVFVLDGRHVANEHVETFLLCQHCGTGSTLAGSKNNYSFHCFMILEPRKMYFC